MRAALQTLLLPAASEECKKDVTGHVRFVVVQLEVAPSLDLLGRAFRIAHCVPGSVNKFLRYLVSLKQARVRASAVRGRSFMLLLPRPLELPQELHRVDLFAGDPALLALCVAEP